MASAACSAPTSPGTGPKAQDAARKSTGECCCVPLRHHSARPAWSKTGHPAPMPYTGTGPYPRLPRSFHERWACTTKWVLLARLGKLAPASTGACQTRPSQNSIRQVSARTHSQNTCFRAALARCSRRRLREEAAVAWASFEVVHTQLHKGRTKGQGRLWLIAVSPFAFYQHKSAAHVFTLMAGQHHSLVPRESTRLGLGRTHSVCSATRLQLASAGSGQQT